MERYDLSRLNGQSFERLVRALCFKQFGAGGIVYSSGPDGGRDFVLRGKVAGYSSRNWDGHLVVQCKFREISTAESDADWLHQQLRREFASIRSINPLGSFCDYYILASNVRLSGSDSTRGKRRSGGYSKTESYLAEWRKAGLISDFDIWSSDKIIDLLIGAPDVRVSYLSWITPGDILASVFQELEMKKDQFLPIIRRSLKASLRRDQNLPLKESGSVRNESIRSSQVFVDLPYRPAHYAHNFTLKEQDQRTQATEPNPFAIHRVFNEADDDCSGVVASIIFRSRDTFAPIQKTAPEQVSRGSGDDHRGHGNKIVLLGGPGQGKSTVTKYIAQIFRAALLETDQTSVNDVNISTLMPEILQRARHEGIETAIPRRYPVHVSLPAYADYITKEREAGHPAPSLLSFIARDIAQLSDSPAIELNNLRDWLKKYPWIILLDGLDEIPISGERTAVLDGLAALVSEEAEANADLLMLVTTRPQGYNSDLDARIWEHWSLDELTKPTARKYARALAKAIYPADGDRCKAIEDLFERATELPTAQRLMVSPLQVTVLFIILDSGNVAPESRWHLFNDYFEILRKRERAKGGKIQKVIVQNWTHLPAIHRLSGLALHLHSEKKGGAVAFLSADQFRILVSKYLQREGFEGSELHERVTELIDVALNRLVLLSARNEGQITFDLRSLQEFMAACELTAADFAIVHARLSYIADKGFWHHVFLMAAGRCFAEDGFQYQRQSTLAIPRQLDAQPEIRLVRKGARLAFDMFLDGIGADQPLHRRQLTIHALELLDLGPGFYDRNMQKLWEVNTQTTITEGIRERINSGNRPALAGALLFAFYLINSGKSSREDLSLDFTTLGTKRSSIGVYAFWETILQFRETVVSQPLAELITDRIVYQDPAYLIDIDLQFLNTDINAMPIKRDVANQLTAIKRMANWQGNNSKIKCRIDGNDSGILFWIYTVDQSERFRDLELTGPINDDWMPIKITLSFSRSPDRASLSSSLRALAGNEKIFDSARRLATRMPWPLGSIIRTAKSPQELEVFATRAADGEFGNVEDWRQAEVRWKDNGANENDILEFFSNPPFNRDIGRIGFPLDVGTTAIGTKDILITVRFFLEKVGITPSTKSIYPIHWLVGQLVESQSPKERIGKDLLELLFSISEDDLINVLTLYSILRIDEALWKDENILDRLSTIVARVDISDRPLANELMQTLIEVFDRAPSRRWLLYPIAAAWAFDEAESPKLNASAFAQVSGDAPIIVATSFLLSCAAAFDKDAFNKLELALRSVSDQSQILHMIEKKIDYILTDPAIRLNFLLHLVKLLDGISPDWNLTFTSSVRSFRGKILKLIDGRKADFRESCNSSEAPCLHIEDYITQI